MPRPYSVVNCGDGESAIERRFVTWIPWSTRLGRPGFKGMFSDPTLRQDTGHFSRMMAEA
jgi:hypothetical protein